ncbi:MAG: type IV toxin-antitoxin system AbiEi family antitoxin domain-containing protein, partial [Nocardioidaceae bacterium]
CGRPDARARGIGHAAAMPVPARLTSGPLLGTDFPLPLESPFTPAMAHAAGITRAVLARLLRDGYVRRMLRGVYVPAQVVDGLSLRASALHLVVPRHAVVTDWTAVWLFTGLLPPNDHLRVPPVSMFLPAGKGRLRNALCRSGERSFLGRDLMTVGGLRVTTPLRTAWDMGRLTHRDSAISALDALLGEGSFTRPELLGGLERFRGQRGVVQLRQLAPLADMRAESPAESVLRLRWLDLTSLPRPRPQVPVLDDDGFELFRLDLGVEELCFAVEYDGEEFHSRPEDLLHDARRREWIRRERGWVIEVVRRENVFGATRDVEEILHRGVREARRRLAAPHKAPGPADAPGRRS